MAFLAYNIHSVHHHPSTHTKDNIYIYIYIGREKKYIYIYITFFKPKEEGNAFHNFIYVHAHTAAYLF
jgi:hypothetical protein